jgi:hypothetical protein
MRICKKAFVLLAVTLAGYAMRSATAEPSPGSAPFRVCGLAGTAEKPWVGIVWKDDEQAYLLRLGEAARGYALKRVDVAAGRVIFEKDGAETVFEVEADPEFAERHAPTPVGPVEQEVVTAADFLNKFSVVTLADGTRLERPPGGWPTEPVTFDDFVKQYEGREMPGLTAQDIELAERMKEAAAESERAAQQMQSPEDMERARMEALKKMAAEAGMEPPSPDMLKPTTYEDFIRMHGDVATPVSPVSDGEAETP